GAALSPSRAAWATLARRAPDAPSRRRNRRGGFHTRPGRAGTPLDDGARASPAVGTVGAARRAGVKPARVLWTGRVRARKERRDAPTGPDAGRHVVVRARPVRDVHPLGALRARRAARVGQEPRGAGRRGLPALLRPL